MLIVAIALLATRVGGVHMHLCFDGREPPASIHLQDSGLHHADSGMKAGHQDLDVAAVGDLVTKFGLDSLGLIVAAVWIWNTLLAPRTRVPDYRAPQPYSSRHFIRPSLRGPPLSASV